MEEMERLLAIVRQLVEQVKALAETSNLLIQRQEQLFRMQEERLSILPQLAENQTRAIEELETTNQALQESLDDLDGNTDAIVKATAALLVIQQQQNQQSGQASPA